MATVRQPLAVRPKQGLNKTTRSASGTKRPRSPDNDATCLEPIKRRAVEAVADLTTRLQDKERKLSEKIQREIEWREKYTRAFPSFRFHFDTEHLTREHASLKSRILQLGGDVDDFFSKDITHFITDHPLPDDMPPANKENNPKAITRRATSLLKSPTKPRARNDSLIYKALEYNLKIWNAAKLETVIERCLPATSNVTTRVMQPSTSTMSKPQRNNLERLLQMETNHGSTERDPTQRRHDFTYFERGHMFVLVEDMDQTLATIVAHQYDPPKRPEDDPAWPVLYCHPKSRNPFIPFNEKEKRRWEKSQREEKEKEAKQHEQLKNLKLREASRKSQGAGDLRRTVSMNNMHKRLAEEEDYEEEVPEDADSANASGYLASGYMAASGNSVAITSANGTTSTSGSKQIRHLQVAPALRKQMNQEVVTSRKVTKETKTVMGPPSFIPDKGMLRRSRSTSTMRSSQRLPKRQEGTKPGYCENCRVKFEDFKDHVRDRKHRRFAMNSANFVQLDALLDSITRRTIKEVQMDDQWIECDAM